MINSHWQTKDQNWDLYGFGPNPVVLENKLGPQWFWTKIGTPVVSDNKLGPQWFWTICAKTYNRYCSHSVFLVKTTPWRFYGIPTNQNWTLVVFVHLSKNLQLVFFKQKHISTHVAIDNLTWLLNAYLKVSTYNLIWCISRCFKAKSYFHTCCN